MTSPTLPGDIFRLVFGHLEAGDIRVCRRVCKEFLELSNLRSIWDALLQKAIQKNIPVPGLDGKSLESLSAKDVEIGLHRALTLRQNWISRSPILKRRISLNATPQNRVVSVQFVPGDDHRWLISLSMSQRRSFVLHCWDLRTSTCIARRDIPRFGGMAVNKIASDAGIVAILSPHIEIIRLKPDAINPDDGFLTLSTYPEETQIGGLHMFSGSSLVTRDNNGQLAIWDVRSPHSKMEIRNPEIPTGTALVDMIITQDFILALRLITLELYALPSTAETTHNTILHPVYVYKLPWRVDNGVMTIRRHPGTKRFNDIYIVLRYGSYYPWAINLLHHYEIRPNRFFLNDGPISAANLPYQFPPVLQETIASPVRLHATSDLAVGPYGTVLWTDSHTEDYFNHADRGQRLAGRFSSLVEEGNDDDEVELSNQTATASAASVYAYQEEDSWVRVALDEIQGRIALGRDDGVISVLEFI